MHNSGKINKIGGLYAIIDNSHCPNFTHAELAKTLILAGVRIIQLRVKNLPERQVLNIAKTLRDIIPRGQSSMVNGQWSMVNGQSPSKPSTINHQPSTISNDCLLIINDFADVAKRIDADGVHLGQDDMSLKRARDILGEKFIIGISTHNINQAIHARERGADYIGLGPIFPTTSKEYPTKVGMKKISYETANAQRAEGRREKRRNGESGNRENPKSEIRNPLGLQVIQEVKADIDIPVIAIGGIKIENIHEVLSSGADGVAVISALYEAGTVYENARTLVEKVDGCIVDG